MKKLTKEREKEVREFADKYEADALNSAITLISLLDKETDLEGRVNVLRSGLLAFLLMVQEKEEKIN